MRPISGSVNSAFIIGLLRSSFPAQSAEYTFEHVGDNDVGGQSALRLSLVSMTSMISAINFLKRHVAIFFHPEPLKVSDRELTSGRLNPSNSTSAFGFARTLGLW